MGIIVQKFGGTSVGNVERIRNTVNRIIEEKEKGHDVVVVVSAMGKTTDQLVGLANELSAYPAKREMDMLLSTGEQVTISLVAMALIARGYDAVSYTGWQAGIITEPVHGNARITEIRTEKIKSRLAAGQIVIVAGFQGITPAGEIATLGRGGSDTTAVALAAALHADRCLIYTDVTGVFTSDPRYIPNARKLKAVSYDEMLELASLGAGVLHARAVEFAKNAAVPLIVCSSLEREEGTLIEEEVSVEKNLIVRGVAFEDGITRVTIFGLENGFRNLPDIFTTLAEHHIDVDIIIQNQTADHKTYLSFSIKDKDLKETADLLEAGKEALSIDHFETETGLAKVSIIGSGMVSNPGVAAKMFQVLADHGIAIKMISTSEIKVSTVVDAKEMVRAARCLHEAFELDAVEQNI
ncbi:aspartate kinase [Weizmannia coagulans]|uniref:Aspartokinase n=2 Tax=Heyndrickxia TaxID=2837504 RepID=A0AAN0T635_HEYCO|nr:MULTISPECIES: aspartate kinase [Heyndrickxia]AJO22340.1 aspartate kinase [Heyndrickxia coagulans]AKN56125.1 Aspartokinase [Heyndrickxia coagulans]ATW82681.1 aspartate kinase [Heyndrickxia coagulans]AVD56664.1 aspartate kinase [Heyndrickxia coagulans]KGB28828.1 aspartate kinase [Heyndrickxia coagulans]